MNAFSGSDGPRYEELRLPHVRVLLEVVADLALRDKQHVRRRYAENASHFDSTLTFAAELGLLSEVGDMLVPAPEVVSGQLDEATLAQLMLSRLVGRNTPCRLAILDYLRRFRIIGGEAVYQPALQGVPQSGIRNLLMELGAVVYDSTRGRMSSVGSTIG